MKVVDISGMDPARSRLGYEWGCQVICLRALRWMRTHGDVPMKDASPEIYAYILEHPELRKYGPTGAMMHFAIAHATERFLLGDESYLARFRKQPKRLFEFDEADAFPEDKKGPGTS